MIRIALALIVALSLAGCWQKNVGRTYYPSGKVRSEATIRNNVVDGPAVMYYESGKKMSEAHYTSGVLDGKSTAYYESGARKAEAEYKNGVLDGASTSWAENGAVRSQVRFEAGHVVAPPGPVPAETEKASK